MAAKAQGSWTEDEYFSLPGMRLVEFSRGCVEVLPMPTRTHQLIARFLDHILSLFVAAGRLGTVLNAPFPVRLWEEKYREPDVMLMLIAHRDREHEDHWEGADLVIEVVSGGRSDRRRDLVTKRAEYARAGIPEYWIVDPEEQKILVLTLDAGAYHTHGEFGSGDQATSALLPGFTVDVDAAFAAGAA